MRLADALRLTARGVVAFTGAGGKSSAIERVAEELAVTTPVIVTTTTRISLHQRRLATDHLILQDEADFRRLADLLRAPRSILVTRRVAAGEPKWLGLDLATLEEVRRVAGESGACILIEADGARGRSLKAPAEHEPVVPPFADIVVPLVGLDVVGQPVSSEYVHRPERVARLTGLGPDDVLQPQHIAQVLCSPEGGLQGIPPRAEVRILLNKADDEPRLRSGLEIAGRVLGEARIRATVIGSVAEERPVRAVLGRVAGVVLAAGGSRRLGESKQLVAFHGKPLVWHAVQAALNGGLTPVIVVLGSNGPAVRAALEGLPVRFVENPSWQSGQASSMRAGLNFAQRGSEASVFLLADMPFVSGEVVRALVAEHRSTLTPIVAPRVEGVWCNPVLFDRSTYRALQALDGDAGGRQLFDRFRMAGVPWPDRLLRIDVDTPVDLAELRQLDS
jgi:molybdenum cofactor cytidylyltransferase